MKLSTLRRLAFAFVFIGCTSEKPTELSRVASIRLVASAAPIASGATVQLTAEARDSRGNPIANQSFTWSSSDSTIARVSAAGLATTGVVTGGSNGTVTISASAQSVTGSATLSVLPSPIALLSILAQTDSVDADATLPLRAILKDANGNVLSGRTINWTTGDTAIATVSTDGVISPRTYAGAMTRSIAVQASVDAVTTTASIVIRPARVARLVIAGFDSSFFVDEAKSLIVSTLSRSGLLLTGRTINIDLANRVIAMTNGTVITARAVGRSAVLVQSDTAKSMLVVRVDTATTFSIPVDLRQTTYPQSYATSTRSHRDLSSDSCAVSDPSGVIAVPKMFLGSRVLPTLAAANQLPSTAMRGMRMKDVWDKSNAAFVRGCTTDIRSAFRVTLQRLRQLNAEYVTLTPWTFGLYSDKQPWRIMNPAELRSSTMDDEDLRWAIAEAHSQGLKVHWLNQIQGWCRDSYLACGGLPGSPVSVQSVAKFMGLYREYMLERAGVLQQAGVDVMQLGCSCWFPTWTDADIGKVYLDSLTTLAPDVRNAFRGKLRLPWNSMLPRYQSLVANIDYVEHSTWSNISPDQYTTVSVDALAKEYQENWECQVKRCNPYGSIQVPAIFNIAGPSREMRPGSYEETFCTASVNESFASSPTCIQRSLKTDFSIQTLIIQALLKAFTTQTIVPAAAFENGDYWPVDKLDPTTSFPNIGYTVRNKPAEGILMHWFRRTGSSSSIKNRDEQ